MAHASKGEKLVASDKSQDSGGRGIVRLYIKQQQSIPGNVLTILDVDKPGVGIGDFGDMGDDETCVAKLSGPRSDLRLKKLAHRQTFFWKSPTSPMSPSFCQSVEHPEDSSFATMPYFSYSFVSLDFSPAATTNRPWHFSVFN